MECRTFDLTILSANNVEDVRRIGKTEAHARVYIAGVPEAERRTPTDTHGRRNPAWNFTTSYTIFEPMLKSSNTVLVVKLYCTRSMGDRYIGEVHVPIRELFEHATKDNGGGGEKSSSNVIVDDGGRSAMMTLPLQKGSVKSQGALRISYSFGEKVVIDKLLMANVATRSIFSN